MYLIFTDDLTGACDVAAATGHDATVVIRADGNHHARGVVIFNTENRTRTPDAARAEVRNRLATLGPFITQRMIAYWKMDSLLRGNWAHEIAQLIESGAARRFAIAPAFPEQERITAQGVQYARGVPVRKEPVLDQLAAAGVAAGDVRVIDAATFDDLRGAARSLAPDELPVGSAGFARAIWGPRTVEAQGVRGWVLVIVGTASPRGEQQIDSLRRLERVRLVEPAPQSLMMAAVEQCLADGAPAALVVAGGETLSNVARLLSIESLIVQGEVAPGIALASISGGVMDGRQMITKAGDFGSPDTLLDLCRQFA